MAAPADYAVVTKESVEELVREVKVQVAAGWKPVGGIALDRDDTTFPQPDGSYDKPVFYQALYKDAVP